MRYKSEDERNFRVFRPNSFDSVCLSRAAIKVEFPSSQQQQPSVCVLMSSRPFTKNVSTTSIDQPFELFNSTDSL